MVLVKIMPRFYQNNAPILSNSFPDFIKIIPRFYQNHSPILSKSLPDFIKIIPRFYQNRWWFGSLQLHVLKLQAQPQT